MKQLKDRAALYRQDFPVLSRLFNDRPLVYLDNAATTQKPLSVINGMADFDRNEYATVHRGNYRLSMEATDKYLQTRELARQFLNAKSTAEIIFVKGTTEAINLVATAYGEKFLKSGDEIIISAMEHHANLLPWFRLRDRLNITIVVAPLTPDGALDMTAFQALLSKKTKLVAIAHVSNVLGTINPVQEITRLAHSVGAKVLLDGAQAAPHIKVDVQSLGCDFYCLSAHKMYGPSGFGLLFGREELLSEMNPYQVGGDMIIEVDYDKIIYQDSPLKFEAGTPLITQAIGFALTLQYLQQVGLDFIEEYEHYLLKQATAALKTIPGLTIIGEAPQKSAVISFILADIHPHDIGTILDNDNIAIRTGKHCAHPLLKSLKLPATARASFSFYNTEEEINLLVQGLIKAQALLK